MLFQNSYDSVEDQCLEISKQANNVSSNKTSLNHIFNCQKLVRYGIFSSRDEIPDDFQTKIDSVKDQIKITASEKYKTWHLVKSRVPELSNKVSSGVPSFISVNSLRETNYASITTVVFTSIIPYPATDYDTISTAMINFQDVLLQKGLACAPLRSFTELLRSFSLFGPLSFKIYL